MNETEIAAREFAATKIRDKNRQPDNDIFFAAKEGFEKGVEWHSAELILYWEGELKLWRSVSENPLAFTNEQKNAAPHYCAAICVLLNQLKAK